MKTSIALLAAVLAAPLAASAGEKSLKKSDVPAPVLETVQKKYADAKQTGYQMEVENGKTEYEVKLERGKEKLEVSLTADGKIVSEEAVVAFEAVPENVRKAFSASKYGSWKVKKAEKVAEGEDGATVKYEIAAHHGKEAAEVVFDSAGKIVKEEHSKAGKHESKEEKD